MYKEIINNLTDLRNVKGNFYEKYNKLINEFRTPIFEVDSEPVIVAPHINAVNTFYRA